MSVWIIRVIFSPKLFRGRHTRRIFVMFTRRNFQRIANCQYLRSIMIPNWNAFQFLNLSQLFFSFIRAPNRFFTLRGIKPLQHSSHWPIVSSSRSPLLWALPHRRLLVRSVIRPWMRYRPTLSSSFRLVVNFLSSNPSNTFTNTLLVQISLSSAST